MSHSKFCLPLTCSFLLWTFLPQQLRAEKVLERLDDAANVLTEIMSAPDKGIPEDLLGGAKCIVIIPAAKKAAFIVGGRYGSGFVSCRTDPGEKWSAPAAVRMEGGSIGWQIGGSESDIVMLVMNDDGMRSLLTSKFTLGGSASAAAGPVGRSVSARTDAKLTAGILSYSRTRGVFAGVSVGGATLRNDLDANKELYGKPLTNKDVIMGHTPPPPAASHLMAVLNKYAAASRHTG